MTWLLSEQADERETVDIVLAEKVGKGTGYIKVQETKSRYRRDDLLMRDLYKEYDNTEEQAYRDYL